MSCHLEHVSFGPKFYRDSGSIPKKMHAFFCKSHTSLQTFIFLLTKYKKIWDISNNTEKINLRVALFLEHKPQNLPSNSHFNLSNTTLRYAYSYFILHYIVSNLYHMYLYHMYLSLLKTYMVKESLFNIKLLAFSVISLSLSLFIKNNSFVGNNKLYQ